MARYTSPVLSSGVMLDDNGKPLAGGKLFAYAEGSFSVLQTTYSEGVGGVENANPIVLNSAGRLPTSVWLDETQGYTLVLTKADGTTVLETHTLPATA